VPRQSPPRVNGPRMPESVLRKRPAEIVVPPATELVAPQAAEIVAPPPGVITGPLPPTPAAPGRRPPKPRKPRKTATRGREPRPTGFIALALLFLGLFVVAMGLGAATDLDFSFGSGRNEPPPRAFPVLDPSRPERLTIPSIKVAAPILDVGLASDGSVGVPPLKRHNEAGWFDGGPTPGQFGPALIVGHADTRTGPSVFHDLHRMKPGQKIEVLRADRSVAVFQVNSVEHFNKGKLPVKRVYGDYTRPQLRLMTCGGEWLGDRSGGYSDNVVVFASLVSSRDN
jgi:Sortase domain